MNTAGELAKWSFRPSFEKEPMEKHKDITELIKDWGGEEDPKTHRVVFPRILKELPRDDRRGLLGKTKKDGEEIVNPLYGMNESGFLVMAGTATARYSTRNVSTACQGIGQIFKHLPSNAPDYGIPDDYDWLKAPPSIEEVARTEEGVRWHDIEHMFLLSPEGGWPPAVYEFIEL